MGSAPIWAPPHSHPGEASISPAPACTWGSRDSGKMRKRHMAWSLWKYEAPGKKTQTWWAVGGPGRRGPSEALDGASLCGQVRLGTWQSSCPRGASLRQRSGHLLPGPQPCSHSLGRPQAGGKSCSGRPTLLPGQPLGLWTSSGHTASLGQWEEFTTTKPHRAWERFQDVQTSSSLIP